MSEDTYLKSEKTNLNTLSRATYILSCVSATTSGRARVPRVASLPLPRRPGRCVAAI